MYKRYKKSKNTKNQETTKIYRNRDTKYINMEIQTYKGNIREYTQYQCHRSHMGRGPQFFQNGDLKGLSATKKGDQKMRIFDKLTERR